MRDPVPDQRVRFRPNPLAARNVRYANHGSEHIPGAGFLLGGGWPGVCGAKQQKIGAAHGRPGLRVAWCFLGG
jgi:hypothetical protein